VTTVSPTGGTSAAGAGGASAAGATQPPQNTTSVRRVAIASCIGTTIEFYDFFIYGTAAALVFPTVFFPALGATAGTVASFATFAVAFIARPVGAMLFGHFGDRIGRKKTLISTLLLMGISTLLIGLLPGAATIGVAAPIILVLLRFGQGFAVGGEWAGATLLTAEYAPPGKRGLYAMFPQLGPAIAFVLSSSTFLITGAVLGDTNQAFLDYGWRIPFLFSIVLVGIGLYMRLAIEETPVFKAEQAERVAERVEAALVGDRLAVEQPPDEPDGLVQPVEPLAEAGPEVDAEGLVLPLEPATPDPQDEPTAGQVVDRRRLLGDEAGVAEGVRGDEVAERGP